MKGFCAPNVEGLFSEQALRIISAGRFASAKIRGYHDKANILSLMDVGVRHFLSMWPDFKQGQKWQDHADKCWATIERQYPLCNIWVVGNEPNDADWVDKHWEYATYMMAVLRDVKSRADARSWAIYFVLPPLSYAPRLWPKLNDWREAFTMRPDPHAPDPAFREYCQYAGANCYWEFPGRMLDGSFGMLWQDVARWARLPTIITEFGYSGLQTGRVGPDVGHALMAKQYPAYIAEAHRRGAVAEYLFDVEGTDDWAGFNIPVEVAGALAEL